MRTLAFAGLARSLLTVLLLSLALAGCVSSRAVDGSVDVYDPLESINRGTFASYVGFDRAVLLPVASAYRDAVPTGVRRSVRRFLDNLDSPAVFANDLLQGRIRRAGNTLLRATINSTVGLGGLFDVAERFHLPRHSNDFGRTLAVYGVGEGAYLFAPLVGPTNLRDLSGAIVDLFLDPIILFQWPSWHYWLSAEYGLNAVDAREHSIETLEDIERTSVDYYATIRGLHWQIRNRQINADQEEITEIPDF